MRTRMCVQRRRGCSSLRSRGVLLVSALIAWMANAAAGSHLASPGFRSAVTDAAIVLQLGNVRISGECSSGESADSELSTGNKAHKYSTPVRVVRYFWRRLDYMYFAHLFSGT